MALLVVVTVAVTVALAACKKADQPAAVEKPTDRGPAVENYDAIARGDFNKWAVRLNLPVYWTVDKNNDKSIGADEVATLLFYPTQEQWSQGGKLTPAFSQAYQRIVAASRAQPGPGTPEETERRRLVGLDLDGARPTLVKTDLRNAPPAERDFARRMLDVASAIDTIYSTQDGTLEIAGQVPADDAASQSLFRRNRGPKCATPAMEKEKACSAIPGAPKVPVDVYPAGIQKDDKFCDTVAANPDAKTLLTPFTAVREKGGKLAAVPYNEAYAQQSAKIAAAVRHAAEGLPADEAPLTNYLAAAAKSFETNDWKPADEAWAKMNAENSRWYVRVGPDETYWEPCSRKAGYHLTFARINKESLEWQAKLDPVRQKMEQTVAEHAGAPYKARTVSFHLPDFIDIAVNAGDDRNPIGATIGQSLPNWGPVAEEGRGRTVAMSNLYTDPDSLAARRTQASSLFDKGGMAIYVDDKRPGLLATILHEATHNLGPAHEYRAGGKTDDEIFGGPLAAMLEELKAQTGGLFLIEFVRKAGIIDDEMARRTYADELVWAMGHIATGMYTPEGKPKAYAQLAAIQVGFLMDRGALTWNPDATAANGQDKGAFTINFDKMAQASDEMMTVVGGIKARGDVAGAKKLVADYVDGKKVPHATVVERWQRQPRVSFVYSMDM